MQYGRSKLFNVPPKEHYDFLLVTISHMSELLRRWSLWTVAWSLVSKN